MTVSCVNTLSSNYIYKEITDIEKLFNWHRLKTEENRKLCKDFGEYADVVIEKTVYTCVNQHFLQRICQLNDGIFPEKLFIAGVDTDCCVLKIATDLFENNIRPVVLTNYCNSNGIRITPCRNNMYEAIDGEKQLYSGEIQSADDLFSL